MDIDLADNTMCEWFEAYFAGLYVDVIDATMSVERSEEQAALIERLLGLCEGARVLDVGCGSGRLAIPLARRGFRVTGIDLSPPLLERARRRVRRAKVAVDLRRLDMRKIDYDGEFDAAFNYFTSFGYFSDEDNASLAAKIFRALAPGGRFAVELVNKPWLVANYREVTTDEVAGVKITSRHEWDAAASRSVSETVFEKGRKREIHHDSVRVYSPAEMKSLLEAAGFTDVRLLSADATGPPSVDHPRFIAVAEKPSAD